ncbi:hypothetical protein RUM43_012277 [Polyplax serrata]|uniref:Alpha-carbonic anhydrase domain-containing protein n=1 Tax=Polyplax serrata TaxID=468196 RepID=A0AAN8NKF2_POLSC
MEGRGVYDSKINYKVELNPPADLGDLSNPELRILTDQLEKIKYGGDEVEVKRISIKSLLPETEYYMTYDGSTTMPACHETVTWVILNKPIYITKQQFVSSHGAETPTSMVSNGGVCLCVCVCGGGVDPFTKVGVKGREKERRHDEKLLGYEEKSNQFLVYPSVFYELNPVLKGTGEVERNAGGKENA